MERALLAALFCAPPAPRDFGALLEEKEGGWSLRADKANDGGVDAPDPSLPKKTRPPLGRSGPPCRGCAGRGPRDDDAVVLARASWG